MSRETLVPYSLYTKNAYQETFPFKETKYYVPMFIKGLLQLTQRV